MSKNTIELNGKRYDAITGKIMHASPTPRAAHVYRAPSATAVHVRVINDVTRPTRAQAATMSAKITPRTKPAAIKVVVQSKRAQANHLKPHKPASAVTLVRTAVQKPGPGLKRHINVQGSLQHTVPSLITPKTSASKVVPERLLRANSIPKSKHITRHHSEGTSNIPVTIAPIPVQTPPVQPTDKGASVAQSHHKSNNIFEQAMKNATNYRELPNHKHFKKRTQRHLASMAASGFALIALTGFLAYQNTPGLQLKVAGMQAGFSTDMPNFKAAGFAFTGVSSSQDKVTLGFSGQQGSYTLTQQATNWSNDDMIRNVGTNEPSGEPTYTRIQAGDNSVYRLSNNSATWVSDGKWYQVSGDHTLTDNQVKSLVNNI